MTPQTPRKGRCSWGVKCLNVLTVLLVLLDLPLAATAPMNIGMIEGAAGRRVAWAEAAGGLMMVYPLLAIPCVIGSVVLAGKNRADASLLSAILPYGVVVPLVTMMVLYV
jgi:hypothetical protein